MKVSIILFAAYILFGISSALGQTIVQPHVGFQSHPTIMVQSVDLTTKYTRVTMEAINYADGGDDLCIDKNTRLSLPNGKKLALISAESLPMCPQNYHFSTKDEKLVFTLVFPPLDPGTVYIDLEEICKAYCLSYKGIIVDKKLNDIINKGYEAYQLKQDEQAVAYFKAAIQAAPEYPYGILYFNIIKVSAELNKWEEVRNWYKVLTNSGVSDKEFYKEKVRNDYLNN